MITVTLARAELVAALDDCPEGIEEFDAIAPTGFLSLEWTPFADIAASVAFPLWIGLLRNRAVVPRANLKGADLRYTYLRGADLNDTNLSYASLRGADLRDANLKGANLRYANLRYANLRYANLKGADLSGANLRGANLKGAYLSTSDAPPPSWVLVDGRLVAAQEPA